MRAVLTRVSSATVTVDGMVTGQIGRGFLILLGVGPEDTEQDCDKLCKKLLSLRIFTDDQGKMNLGLEAVNGQVLVVSQFTLYADCKKGNRPSFVKAGAPDMAEHLYEHFMERCRNYVDVVEKGQFGADMKVELLNDGPFTLMLESEQLFK